MLYLGRSRNIAARSCEYVKRRAGLNRRRSTCFDLSCLSQLPNAGSLISRAQSCGVNERFFPKAVKKLFRASLISAARYVPPIALIKHPKIRPSCSYSFFLLSPFSFSAGLPGLVLLFLRAAFLPFSSPLPGRNTSHKSFSLRFTAAAAGGGGARSVYYLFFLPLRRESKSSHSLNRSTPKEVSRASSQSSGFRIPGQPP